MFMTYDYEALKVYLVHKKRCSDGGRVIVVGSTTIVRLVSR